MIQDQELLRALMDWFPDMIYFKDRDSRFLRINKSLANNFGISDPAEAIGKTDHDYFPAEIADTFRAQERRIIETAEPLLNVEEKQVWPGGWHSWSSTSKMPLYDKDGQITGTFGISRNITHRKVAETQRNAREVELRNAQKMESIGRLAAGIAHEINTPTQFIGDNIRFLHDAFIDLADLLTTHESLLQAALNEKLLALHTGPILEKAEDMDLEFLKAEIPKAIEQSLMGVGRVAKIVGAMKDFSHPGSDTKVPSDLNKAIDTTVTVCRNEWKYVAELELELDKKLPLVPCLPDQFNQVILNLIVNAAHAIADNIKGGTKGRIILRTRHVCNLAIIEVEDTGKGIPDAIRDRVFEPFFTTKEIGKSSGQGLALARTVVVDKLGGTISFESEVGKGTKFIITLPIQPLETKP